MKAGGLGAKVAIPLQNMKSKVLPLSRKQIYLCVGHLLKFQYWFNGPYPWPSSKKQMGPLNEVGPEVKFP